MFKCAAKAKINFPLMTLLSSKLFVKYFLGPWHQFTLTSQEKNFYPVDCGSATPSNGQAVTLSGTIFNQTANISCNAGYTLNGSTTITCTETGWDSLPTCEIRGMCLFCYTIHFFG